jgi:hypothetical protein
VIWRYTKSGRLDPCSKCDSCDRHGSSKECAEAVYELVDQMMRANTPDEQEVAARRELCYMTSGYQGDYDSDTLCEECYFMQITAKRKIRRAT